MRPITDRPESLLKLRDVSKFYGGVTALYGVDLELRRGEVLGLLGQNGAGKSTLVKIMSGAESPSSGHIECGGRAQRFRDPQDARRAGISTIFQELSIAPQLSVAENIFLSDLPRRAGVVDWSRMRQDAREILGSLGFPMDVTASAGSLPVAQRQVIEIAKAVHHGAKVLLLDEPTATLPNSDVAKLFELVERMRASGVSVVYISHRLDEVFEICDRIAVLRDGRHIATQPVADVTPDDAVRLMIGERFVGSLVGQLSGGGHARINTEPVDPVADPVLEVRGLDDGRAVHGVSITVRPGEAVAVTGLVGAGQSELAACIAGARKIASGEVVIDGRHRRIRRPSDAIRLGIGWLPEDRKHQGLVLGMPVSANLTMAGMKRITRGGFLSRRRERRLAAGVVEGLGIKAANLTQPVGSLSGGNQQKVVFGKWLLTDIRVLICSEPTRGIDVAAKQEIYRQLREFLRRGGSVLVLSSEIDEALMCDRVYVIGRGEMLAEFDHDEIDPERLLALLR